MSAPWSRAASAAQRGSSLVGLLIASAVGALVMAGGLTGLARAQSAWQAAGIESRLHERAQYALATLEPELQMAGFFAGAPPQPLPPGAVPPSAARCGEPVVARLDVPIEVADARYPLACAAGGSGHRDGTDAFIVRRLSAASAVSPGRMQWPLCPVAPCAAAPDLPRELVIKAFYVAQAADGDPRTPALRVRSLSAIAGVPAFIDTEVMPGVDDLQITLEPAAAPRSVRITVGVRPDAADQRPRQAPRRLAVTRTFALRNAAPAP